MRICWSRTTSIGESSGVLLAGKVFAEIRAQERSKHSVLQYHVHDTGDGIGAVLSCRAIAKHFEPVDRASRNRIHVHAARARAFSRAIVVSQRGVVTSLAVEQHQRVIGTQAAHREGPHDLGRIRNALTREVHGRRELRKYLCRFRRSLRVDLLWRKYIDRHRKLFGGGVSRSRSNYDIGQRDSGVFDDEVLPDGLAVRDAHGRRRRGVTESSRTHSVATAGNARDHVIAVVPARRAESARIEHDDSLRYRRAGRISDFSADRAALRGGRFWDEKKRENEEGKDDQQLPQGASHNTSLFGRDIADREKTLRPN